MMLQKNRIIIFALLLIILSASTLHPLQAITDEIVLSTSGPEEIIDQQFQNDSFQASLHSNVMLAQSFIPTLSPLTKIDIKINKPRKTESPLSISVKKNISQAALASVLIPAESIPFFSYWIMADISDIEVIPGETYYIVVSTSSPSETPYRWFYGYGEENDPYPDGKMYRSFDGGSTWEKIETEFDYVDATFRTYSYKSQTDMVCDGFFNWTEVQPGQDNLTGSFIVSNTGTPFSKLNWKILTWPSWGTWEFSKKNGSNLRPEDGPFTVTLNVVAPSSNVPDTYTGKIVIINEDDVNDTCEIQARMVTPKSKSSGNEDSDSFVHRLIESIFRYHDLEHISLKSFCTHTFHQTMNPLYRNLFLFDFS
jgi:hypothetical protein